MDPNEDLFLTIPRDGIPATGLYKPPTNIVGYDTEEGENLDPPYNETLIGSSADNIVGTDTNPYLPAILPVYIPTLYTNVYKMQTNLVNDLLVSFDESTDGRKYPTAIAVKEYVASQLSGFENITAGPISTSLTTSILGATTNFASVTTTDGRIVQNHSYQINPIDNARNGAEKIIICNAAVSSTLTMSIAAGTNDTGKSALFFVLGKSYKYYQFAGQGDMIDMVQFIPSGTTDTYRFFVKTYGGKFFN
jgi:hypothetical protein